MLVIKNLLLAVSLLMLLVTAVEEILFFMHMYQLNGYNRKEFLSWLKKNRYVYLGKEFPVILGWLCLLVTAIRGTCGPVDLCLCVFSVLFFIPAMRTNRIRKKKKPLVYTKRVIRMLVTITILELVFLAVAALVLKLRWLGVSYGIFVMITPFLLLLVNLMNHPIEQGINQYYVNDAKKILKSMDHLTIIGITGSFGKTSVKNFLKTLLSAKYRVLMTPHNYNTPMGIVMTIRNELKPIHEIFVCEMGARYVGDIQADCEIAKPDMGVLTAVGYQHLETFESIENIVKTKYELAQAIPEGGYLFANYDNELIADNEETYASHCKLVTYGIENSEVDYRPYQISLSEKGTTFAMRLPSNGEWNEYFFTTRLIGNHNILNIAGAIAVASKLEVPVEDIMLQVRKLEPVAHRLQITTATPQKIIIDDAYNSNPVGAKQSLEVLALFEGMKILITPGMVELGEREFEFNKVFAMQAAQVCDYIIVVGKKRGEPFEAGVAESQYPQNQFYVAQNLMDALSFAEHLATTERKVILLENDLPDNY